MLIDVRKETEFETEHVEDALNIPLDTINDSMNLLSKHKTAYVHCASGYRSMLFISVLRARGYHKLIDVKGGFKAIKDSGRFKINTK